MTISVGYVMYTRHERMQAAVPPFAYRD